jgi:hypothetical protein
MRPRTPRLTRKVGRPCCIEAGVFYRMLRGVVVDQSQLFTSKLQEGEDSTISA